MKKFKQLNLDSVVYRVDNYGNIKQLKIESIKNISEGKAFLYLKGYYRSIEVYLNSTKVNADYFFCTSMNEAREEAVEILKRKREDKLIELRKNLSAIEEITNQIERLI